MWSSLVGNQRISLHRGQQMIGSHQVMHLATGQEESKRIAECIDQCMDRGAH
jgi:hypothetical protein